MNGYPIIDGHLDVAWNKIALHRDLLLPLSEKINMQPAEITSLEGVPCTSYDQMSLGNIRIIFATIWVETERSLYPTIGPKFYSIHEAQNHAITQLEYYKSLDSCKIRIVKSKADINEILFGEGYQLGIVLLIEGADFINEFLDFDFWYDSGVRIVAPVWQKNWYGGCSELGGGITLKGKKFLKLMDEKNIILDLAHMSDKTAIQTAENYNGIVINSHTTCRKYVMGERQISDEVIKLIAKSNGVVGLMTWGKKLKSTPNVSVDDFVDHIDYISDLLGNLENIAFGTSMDGGYGAESLPQKMHSIKDLSLIVDCLVKRNYSDMNIKKILFENWDRALKSCM